VNTRFARPLMTVAPMLVAISLALATSACSRPDFLSHSPQTRGNKVDDDQIAQLIPGTSTRNDAAALLGSPTAKAAFDENRWIYISEVTRQEIGATNSVQAQTVVTLTFEPRGVLKSVEKKTGKDGFQVTANSRATVSPGTEASFMQQLLGNIGRFNPGSAQNGPGSGRGVSGNY
jgi:outer membrane protein assembly factor BamE (lipoprotein component of BamABCDE complex)